MQKVVSDPVQPAKAETPAELKPRTRAQRDAARKEMAALNKRIIEGFQNRSKYHKPRPNVPEPWREHLTEPGKYSFE